MRAWLLLPLLLLPALAGCAQTEDPPVGATDRVVIETDLGNIVLQLEPEKAPGTVENFLKYVDDGFYDGTLFHRIIEDFMIQGGGMDQDGDFKTPTYPAIKNEARDSGLLNVKYSISMARTNDPDSATTQFFINHDDNTFLDPNGGAGYSVFGRVVEGKDVVDAIAGVPVEAYQGRPDQKCQNDGQPSCPVDDVVIDAIRRAGDMDDATATPTPEDPEPVVCASAPAAHGPGDIVLEGDLQAGLITPRTWNLCSQDERMLLWVHNSVDAEVTVELSATLDAAWDLMFEEEELTLAAVDSRDGLSATDWAWTVLHLRVPENAAGEHDLEIHVNDVTVPVTLVVAPEFGTTLERGDRADVAFDGDFSDDGEGFWDGSIPNIQVGGGGLVTGVDLGLLGLGYQETASLIVPPALAYGYDNPEGSGFEQFNGEWLTFTVTVDDF